VLYDVPQSLLRNPKEAQCHILRNLSRNVMMAKLDLYVVLLGEFSAEAPQGDDQTQSVQLEWVKLVGQVVNVGRNFPRYFRNVE
jgi:hypothetical protein